MKHAIHLTEQQRAILLEITRSRVGRQDHSIRGQVILLSAEGYSDVNIGRKLGLSNITVGKWRRRWGDKQMALLAMENQEARKMIDYKRYIRSVLSDAPRAGAPPKFTEEQLCQLLAVACEKPEESGLPLSHWSLSSLGKELQDRRIVESISTSQLAVFLKSGQTKAA